MTLRQAVNGLLQLCALLFVLGTGVFLVGLWCVPQLSMAVGHALETESSIFAVIGWSAVAFALLLGMWFWFLNRGQVLLLRMGTSVDVQLLKQAIAPLLQKQFEGRVALSDVQVFRGKDLAIGLKIQADNREALLVEAERSLQELLVERFGFTRPFLVQVTL